MEAMTLWVDEIRAAFEALQGAASYRDLYAYIEKTTKRALTKEWKASVRRTIEDHSSDSDNHRAADLFQKFGHGHWGLRGANVSDDELIRRDNLTAEEVIKEVFVREHWRSYPTKKDDLSFTPADERLSPTAAWCTNAHIEVELISGVKLSIPLRLYPRLSSATPIQRANIQMSQSGIRWPDVDVNISIHNLLRGMGENPPEGI